MNLGLVAWFTYIIVRNQVQKSMLFRNLRAVIVTTKCSEVVS